MNGLSELYAELENLCEVRNDLLNEMRAYEGSKTSVKKGFEFGLTEINRNIASVEKQIAEQERWETIDSLVESPRGKLLTAVAWAMQYDYLSGEDYESILQTMDERLAKDGLRVEVVKIDS